MTNCFQTLSKFTKSVGQVLHFNAMTDGMVALVEDDKGEAFEIMVRPASLAQFYGRDDNSEICGECGQPTKDGHTHSTIELDTEKE